jgi:hypothetical protein
MTAKYEATIDGLNYIKQELKGEHYNKKFFAEILFHALEGFNELAINKNISLNDITVEVIVDFLKNK